MSHDFRKQFLFATTTVFFLSRKEQVKECLRSCLKTRPPCVEPKPTSSLGSIPLKTAKSAPVKLIGTSVEVPSVKLDCSRRKLTSTASP